MKIKVLLFLISFLACVSAVSAAFSLLLVYRQSEGRLELVKRIEALEIAATTTPVPSLASESVQDSGGDAALAQSLISDLHQHEKALADQIDRLSRLLQDAPQTEPAN